MVLFSRGTETNINEKREYSCCVACSGSAAEAHGPLFFLLGKLHGCCRDRCSSPESQIILVPIGGPPERIHFAGHSLSAQGVLTDRGDLKLADTPNKVKVFLPKSLSDQVRCQVYGRFLTGQVFTLASNRLRKFCSIPRPARNLARGAVVSIAPRSFP